MAEVVSRYVLQDPLILADEFGGYALVAISFLGLAYCAQERGHIRITFAVERMSRLGAGRTRVVTLALALAMVAVAAWVSWQFLGDSFARNMRSNSLLSVPLKWPQMAMPVGFTLFAVVLLGQLVEAIANLRAGRPADQF
jgi:TRAP-type C4-dicarboxylate transport system permease small subunit